MSGLNIVDRWYLDLEDVVCWFVFVDNLVIGEVWRLYVDRWNYVGYFVLEDQRSMLAYWLRSPYLSSRIQKLVYGSRN